MIPVFRPLLPPAESLLPHLRRMDSRRWYSNHGPLLEQFEEQLAAHFGVGTSNVATCTNATVAITQALKAVGAGQGRLCVMPAWTFVATPAAAMWAGLDPYFLDVSGSDWLIGIDEVRALARTREIGAVVLVSAFGAPLDPAKWAAFSRESGIPVIIDAAAGFDGFAGWGRHADPLTLVVSFHATKVSGIGEGAVVVAGDPSVAERVKTMSNFGFNGSRLAASPGINAKMSEYVAASGLAFLEGWPRRRAEWDAQTLRFAQAMGAVPGVALAPGFGQGWVSSYGLVTLPERVEADAVIAELRGRGIESRQWWGKGCHTHPAYAACERSPLPVTERLGRTVLGLPFSIDLFPADLAEVKDALTAALARSGSRRPGGQADVAIGDREPTPDGKPA